MSLLCEEKKNKKRIKKPSISSWEWKLNFEAKPKFIKFNFQATNILPSSKISPFPINFTLTLTKSHSHKNPKSIKSKFIGFCRKFRFRSAKSESAADNVVLNTSYRQPRFFCHRDKFVAFEEPNFIVSIVIGFIGLLSRSISQKDLKGIIFYSSIILLFIAVIFIISLQRGNPFTDRSIFHY